MIYNIITLVFNANYQNSIHLFVFPKNSVFYHSLHQYLSENFHKAVIIVDENIDRNFLFSLTVMKTAWRI